MYFSIFQNQLFSTPRSHSKFCCPIKNCYAKTFPFSLLSASHTYFQVNNNYFTVLIKSKGKNLIFENVGQTIFLLGNNVIYLVSYLGTFFCTKYTTLKPVMTDQRWITNILYNYTFFVKIKKLLTWCVEIIRHHAARDGWDIICHSR